MPSDERPTARGAIWPALLALMILSGLAAAALVVVALFFTTASVSGHLSLDDGTRVVVESGWRGFDLSSVPGDTRVDIRGRRIGFRGAAVTVDGVVVGERLRPPAEVLISADSAGVVVSEDGRVVWESR